MSERYGECKLCHGMGHRKVGVQQDLNSGVDIPVLEECARCGGTGINGSVTEDL